MLRLVGREGRDRRIGARRRAEIVAVERDDARIVAQPRGHPVEGRARHAARLCLGPQRLDIGVKARRSEEHTSELQSLMRIPYAVFCLKKKKTKRKYNTR